MIEALKPMPLSKVEQKYYRRKLSSHEEIIRKCNHYGVPLEEIPKLNAFFRTIILFEKVKLNWKPNHQRHELWRSSLGPHLDRYEMPKNIEKIHRFGML